MSLALPVLLLSVATSHFSGAALAAAANPDLSGPWIIDKPVTSLTTIDGTMPPLRAEATVRYMLIKEAKSKGDNKYDTMPRCMPPGVPRLSLQPFPWSIVQGDQQSRFVYQWNNLRRDVFMDAAKHDDVQPTNLGQSTGKWDGKTLVVETRHYNNQTLLDDAGLPHSEALQTVERYRLTKGGRMLELTLKITDPQSYLKPWEARLMFKKLPGTTIGQDDCLKRVGAAN
jgi:hypothetical protein